jgi:cytochrome c peroxidase
MNTRPALIAASVVIAAFTLTACNLPGGGTAWSDTEAQLIAELSLSRLPVLLPDPSNAVADDPLAAELGEAFFFDARLSSNGKVSCATCHIPEHDFQDGIPLAKGVGSTNRRTMPIAGTAYAPFLFWDGRKDSQWSQALGPLESAVEHATDRAAAAHLVAAHYRPAYEMMFGRLPDFSGIPDHASPLGNETARAAWGRLDTESQDKVNRVFANVGKAIAAFERTLMPQPGRFDAYADALASKDLTRTGELLTPEERQGLALFIGTANCINCHNGPLLTDQHFHNTGVPANPALPADRGRAEGARAVREDPFNCLGAYSSAESKDCAELRFMTATGEELMRAFKTPSLRGATLRSPYMHAGQIKSLEEVLAHYNAAPAAPEGHSELVPLRLTEKELATLVAFLRTLDEPVP